MEFKIKQSTLRDALGVVGAAADKQRTIPVLNNILIESLGENNVRLTATDLDITIRIDVEAEIVAPGAICIEARKLIEVTRVLPDAEMRFIRDDNAWARMTCGKSKFRFAGVERDKFPAEIIPKSTPVTVPMEVLRQLISRTAFAATPDVARFTIGGVKFELNGKLRLVATDQHRLTLAESDIGAEELIDVLVPKKAALAAEKIQAENVSLGTDDKHIFFAAPGFLLTARKLVGNFPNYELVLPKDNDRTVQIDVADFKVALKQVVTMADETNRSVRMVIRPNEIELRAAQSDKGEASAVAPAKFEGGEIEMAFQWRFMTEFLAECPDDATVSISFKSATDPIEVNIVGDDSYRYIVVPLKLN